MVARLASGAAPSSGNHPECWPTYLRMTIKYLPTRRPRDGKAVESPFSWLEILSPLLNAHYSVGENEKTLEFHPDSYQKVSSLV